MSDSTATVEPTADVDTSVEVDAAESQEELSAFAKAKIAKANSEAANLRKRLKDLEPIAEQHRKAEEDRKTDLQRLSEKHEAALVELTNAHRTVIRERVARRQQLPDELAELLQGDDEDEMTAHAERLAALVSKPDRRPDPSQGAGAATALNGDPLLRDLKSKLGIT